ncbi:aminoglycoside 6-adenylyltransferase [Metabacillus idriensis]|uniref:aminoglycoside 6-adenylyltransferase n=1 Tax=Metabacillus idriensis TaxID=324768 RepID=UPI003D279C97
MAAIKKDLLHDQHIEAFFYGGSIAQENTDLYSDIDLRIVVNPDKWEDFLLNKKIRPGKWGNVLFYEDFPGASYTIAHYDSFIKADVFFYRKEDLTPSVWLKNIHIVRDDNGFMTAIKNESNQLSYKISKPEFEFWRTKFFAYFHEAYRRMMRGELYYAIHCIDSMRQSLAAGWYMECGIQPNSFGDWAKIEGPRSQLKKEQLDLLARFHCGREPEEIYAVMKKMMPEFTRLHLQLGEKAGAKTDQYLTDKLFSMAVSEIKKDQTRP